MTTERNSPANAWLGRAAWLRLLLSLLVILTAAGGCGVNKTRLASEQLIVTDAVDRAIARMDFSPLSDHDVYFDTKYIASVKAPSNVNVEYVISSMRQQMIAYNLRLRDKPDDAELVLEARLGALGADGAESNYGVPGVAAVTAASQFVTGVPVGAAASPEFSLGRKNHQWGAAKIAAFAYDRKSMERVWQSGIATGTSKARESWLLGMGPFQRGEIYDQNGIPRRRLLRLDPQRLASSRDKNEALTAYGSAIDFRAVPGNSKEPAKMPLQGDEGKILPASYEAGMDGAGGGNTKPTNDFAAPVVVPAAPTGP